ncbi:hypothetical protein QUF76_01005 [Desulfobacterales bacterium HSG16]|nr:hypothetical protein [Desulfobacterales bacterium HSG16]
MIPVAQPASEYNIILDTINKYTTTGDFVPLDLKRLKKKANQIKDNVDIAKGFELLGMIACLEGDVNVMHSCHKTAIQQSGQRIEHIINYVQALKSLNLYDDAYNYAFQAYNKDSLNLSSIDIVISMTCIFNEQDKFARYTKEWKKIAKEDHSLMYRPLYLRNDLKSFFKFMRKNPNVLEICNLFAPGLNKVFGTPLNIILEVMPEPGYEDELVAWIQWYGDIDEGIEKYSAFEKWFIDQDYDLKSDVLHFNIEMVGE